MPTRKNYLKKNVKKTKIFRRKSKKINNKHKHKRTHKKNSYKKRHHKKSKRAKILIGGGKWFTYDELPEYNKDDGCPLCLESFSTTPNQPIYKTSCNHYFHNNCLNIYCEDYPERHATDEEPYPEAICPICKKKLGYDAMDVYAFAENSLDANLSRSVRTLYNAQEHNEPFDGNQHDDNDENNPPIRVEARRIEDDDDQDHHDGQHGDSDEE